MRLSRLTWQGAFHHIINHGALQENIFLSPQYKLKFINLLEEHSALFKINIFAYCIMDNHFHLILENTSGRLPDFMRNVCGIYGNYYRKKTKSSGYVFKGRYKSTVIQDNSYLIQAIIYVLNNPVKAGIVKLADDYFWSSIETYFSREKEWVATSLVEELFSTKANQLSALKKHSGKELETKTVKGLKILGKEHFAEIALSKNISWHNSRQNLSKDKEIHLFHPVEKIISEFEKKTGQSVNRIDTKKLAGKRLRTELLIDLKDRTGLKYSEIARMFPFTDIEPETLRSLYRNHKNRQQPGDRS